MFGASVDSPELNKQFSEKNNYNFVLLSDPTKAYAKALGALRPGGGSAQRWTYYIDTHGVVRFIDKGVKVASHGADVVKKMKELGVPKK